MPFWSQFLEWRKRASFTSLLRVEGKEEFGRDEVGEDAEEEGRGFCGGLDGGLR